MPSSPKRARSMTRASRPIAMRMTRRSRRIAKTSMMNARGVSPKWKGAKRRPAGFHDQAAQDAVAATLRNQLEEKLATVSQYANALVQVGGVPRPT